MAPLPQHELAELLFPKVLEAGHLIMELRAKGFSVDRKSDHSPVTEADKKVEENLIAFLSEIEPHIPVIAEEEMASGCSPPIQPEGVFFLIDPLDGTRDFCENRNDFTINIGLIKEERPVFGLIYAPARCELYVTVADNKTLFAKVSPCQKTSSFKDLEAQQIRVRRGDPDNLHALVSRSETKDIFSDRIKQLGAHQITGMSSAVKFCLIARGEADLYPRFGATYEWDTAAGHAILQSAGGTVLTMDGSPLMYGKQQSKYLNGPFLAQGKI